MDIRFRPIGVVHTKARDAEIREKGKARASWKFLPRSPKGWRGIDGYSHLFVLIYFDRLGPDQIGPLIVKPRGLVRRGFKLEDLPELGVFALDSRRGPIR